MGSSMHVPAHRNASRLQSPCPMHACSFQVSTTRGLAGPARVVSVVNLATGRLRRGDQAVTPLSLSLTDQSMAKARRTTDGDVPRPISRQPGPLPRRTGPPSSGNHSPPLLPCLPPLRPVAMPMRAQRTAGEVSARA